MNIILKINFFCLIFLSQNIYSNPVCKSSTPNQFNNLIQQSYEASCHIIRNSPECKELYKKIDEEISSPTEADKMKLSCSARPPNRDLEFTGELALACASGLIVDPIVDLGSFVGVSAAKAVESFRGARECDKSIEEKKRIIAEFNLDAPYFFKYSNVDDEHLKSKSCAQIQVLLLNHKTERNSQLNFKYKAVLSTDPKKIKEKFGQLGLDYYNHLTQKGQSSKGLDLIGQINQIKEQFFTAQKCYSPGQQMRINCEIAGMIASSLVPGALMIKAQRLAKLSNRKVEEFIDYMNKAQRAKNGLSERLINLSEQNHLLSLASKLTDSERVKVFEKVFNRQLTSSESEQLLKMHNIGASEGRGFGSYTASDIQRKRALANEINPQTGKPYFNLNEQKVLLRNGITGGYKYDGVALSRLEDEVRSSIPASLKANLNFTQSQQIRSILNEAYTKGYSYSEREINQMMNQLASLGVSSNKIEELTQNLKGVGFSSQPNYIVQYERASQAGETSSLGVQRLAADAYAMRGAQFEEEATGLYQNHVKRLEAAMEAKRKVNSPIADRELFEIHNSAVKSGDIDKAIKYYQTYLKNQHTAASRSGSVPYSEYVKRHIENVLPGPSSSGVWSSRQCEFVRRLIREEGIDSSYAGKCR